jgi:hypothetical protein
VTDARDVRRLGAARRLRERGRSREGEPMRSHSVDSPLDPQSPIRVFVLVLLLMFSVEGAIMLFLPRLPDPWRGGPSRA